MGKKTGTDITPRLRDLMLRSPVRFAGEPEPKVRMRPVRTGARTAKQTMRQNRRNRLDTGGKNGPQTIRGLIEGFNLAPSPEKRYHMRNLLPSRRRQPIQKTAKKTGAILA